MTVRERIEAEKLENILFPKRTGHEFKVTVRFQKFISRDYPEALAIAKRNQHFMEEGEGDFHTVYASFYPADVDDLHALYDLVKDQATTRIYLNNRYIPYTRDLWLFLFWFYRIRVQPVGKT